MITRKLTTTDAFLVIDVPEAAQATGIVRCARKVLRDGAVNLARSTTYGWALLGERRSGASAGINAEGDAVQGAIAAFAEELAAEVNAGSLVIDAGRGVAASDLAGLWAGDGRPVLRLEPAPCGVPGATLGEELALAGTLAAADVALRARGLELAGATVALEITGLTAQLAGVLVAAAGAKVTTDGPADLLLAGSKPGAIDHTTPLPHQVVAAAGPLPITARGLATAGRQQITVLPDFLCSLGTLLAHHPDEGETAETLIERAVTKVRALATEAVQHELGAYLGACEMAERTLSGWCDPLPFGRPIA